MYANIFGFQIFLHSFQVENAIEYLKAIGALDENENLTVLGKIRVDVLLIICLILQISDVSVGVPIHMNFVMSVVKCGVVIGRNLSMLPVEPKLGKMLILGSIFNCLDPIMTVVASLSIRDPFLMPFDKKDVRRKSFILMSYHHCFQFKTYRVSLLCIINYSLLVLGVGSPLLT